MSTETSEPSLPIGSTESSSLPPRPGDFAAQCVRYWFDEVVAELERLEDTDYEAYKETSYQYNFLYQQYLFSRKLSGRIYTLGHKKKNSTLFKTFQEILKEEDDWWRHVVDISNVSVDGIIPQGTKRMLTSDYRIISMGVFEENCHRGFGRY